MADKHGCGFEVIARDANYRATKWLGTCTCGTKFSETTYEATEDAWRQHCYEVNGIAPKAMGNQEGRWLPSVPSL
ncbi:hypothetical protein GUY44_12105 [Pimelobacter simplex]|uniref:Uncharacterized protein n=1 Tax=Nocardioides simplex TaxID=2045 RepID=A0A0A1DHQ4_NOCSI|nr:hypothetical protein [Pimelobacter simplex]AIY16162.1 hypothetical protein KR76_04220 [Pimelobacter simplex]MCG8151226.1 hypothetical protein [Pimelobacter simplex]GEB17179.1 hypothetical protein NSI01_54940 [Pimelobacter simplex]SFN19077.1 hypothetical protein SAMN05421671_0042 [Pimelobacter simplex]